MIFKQAIRAERFTLLFAVLLVVFYNTALLDYIREYRVSVSGVMKPSDWGFMLSTVPFFSGFLVIFFALFSYRYLQKPLAILLILGAASASFFMSNYGIMFDKSMIQNMMGTDATEAFELLSPAYILSFLVWGVLPAILIYWLPIQYAGFFRQSLRNVVLLVVGVALMSSVMVIYFADYASMLRNKREIRFMINPMSYVVYGIKHVVGVQKVVDLPMIQISEDAKKGSAWSSMASKQLMVFVMGETARAQNFSLQGYQKLTTPNMDKLQATDNGFAYFSQVASCGTATAVSLPCIFSKFGRTDYDDEKGRRYEGLLDVMSAAGMSVYWRENNTGCKGVCDRVNVEELAAAKVPEFCEGDCFDEVLLHQLGRMIDSDQQDMVIVLHQNGSHGPTYHARVPEHLKQFKPACETSQLNQCTSEEIVSAYDNTIYYTDYFLQKVVDLLKSKQDVSSAMFYVSDHGESLGEKNMYLHGAPYFMAPKEQTHVPMMMWLSERYQLEHGIDMACVRQRADSELSHDNVFHSVLGMMNIESSSYQSALDFTEGCKTRILTAEVSE